MIIVNDHQAHTILSRAFAGYAIKPNFLRAALYNATEWAETLKIDKDPYMDESVYMEKNGPKEKD